MMYHEFKSITTFDWKDLHKKFGMIVVQEPTDSDLQEGQHCTQIWFVESNGTMYLLDEKHAEQASESQYD